MNPRTFARPFDRSYSYAEAPDGLRENILAVANAALVFLVIVLICAILNGTQRPTPATQPFPAQIPPPVPQTRISFVEPQPVNVDKRRKLEENKRSHLDSHDAESLYRDVPKYVWKPSESAIAVTSNTSRPPEIRQVLFRSPAGNRVYTYSATDSGGWKLQSVSPPEEQQYYSSAPGSYYDFNYRPPVGEHYVQGHLRKNGSYVSGHNKTNSDDSFWNNWSSKGNLNPHTGRVGNKLPTVSRSGRGR